MQLDVGVKEILRMKLGCSPDSNVFLRVFRA